MRRRIENHYFKDNGSHTALMSGLPLPTMLDGKVHDIDFVQCDFHPWCEKITFVNCTFTSCTHSEDLTNQPGQDGLITCDGCDDNIAPVDLTRATIINGVFICPRCRRGE